MPPFDASGPSLDAALEAGSDASTGESEGGVDTDAGAGQTPVVSNVSFSIPQGTIIPRVGTAAYGLLFMFNVACAGHLQVLPSASSSQNPQALPIGCFDASGQMLGPENYVFGFTRIYVYDPSDPGPATVNHNPVVAALDTPSFTEPDGALSATAASIGVSGGEGPPNLTASAHCRPSL